ncbi:MAG: hypothetical protein RJA22_654 [Verrucomicrobiota bacterium]
MMKTSSFLTRLSGAALLGLGLLATPALVQAEQHLSTRYALPVQIQGRITATDCHNSPGPEISLEGDLILGGVRARMIFQNNTKGTHTATVTTSADVSLINLGDAITLPKQPVRGGVGGNPHIWIQFHDGAGRDLSQELYLGRCVQGLSISPSFLNEVLAVADVAALDCANSPGPIISVGGTITLSGLHARFIFRNNLKGTHTAEDTREVTLISSGSQITIPKQPVLGGAGGNPIISFQFVDGNGTAITSPVRLGRCNQL